MRSGRPCAASPRSGRETGARFRPMERGRAPKLGGVGRQTPGVGAEDESERTAAPIVRPRGEHRRCGRLAGGDPARLWRPVGHTRERRVVERLERRPLRREHADEDLEGSGRRGGLFGVRRIGRGRSEIRPVASVDRVDSVVDRALDHRQAERRDVRRLPRGRGSGRRDRVPISHRIGARLPARRGRHAAEHNQHQRNDNCEAHWCGSHACSFRAWQRAPRCGTAVAGRLQIGQSGLRL